MSWVFKALTQIQNNWLSVLILIMPTLSFCACTSMQEDLKTTQGARDREAKQMAQLERTRQRNPSDRQIIVSLPFLSSILQFSNTESAKILMQVTF